MPLEMPGPVFLVTPHVDGWPGTASLGKGRALVTAVTGQCNVPWPR